jgi:protein phosphatase
MDLDVWLLEYGALLLDEKAEPIYPNLLPELREVWQEASPLCQLIWLQQMAQLWRPLQGQGVVSALLNPSLVRVNGPNIQLWELPLDEHKYHVVRELMAVWSDLFETAHPAIADFCKSLGEKLQKGKIPHADHLVAVLEVAITELAPNYHYHYQVITTTDTGPRRTHNEDACYPPVNQLKDGNQPQETLTIICDGIGGQDAGEIASQLAVEQLSQHLTTCFEQSEPKSPQDWFENINQAIFATNNLVSQRNDQENRTERDRMGTTLVMSLARNHELYFANLGDSRLYWITPTSCQQVTVDDDLASREVCLGYGIYRNIQQYSHAGSLTQAIGIMRSEQIHPAIERLLISGEGLFLLCSDGLSDLDRVEQYWQSELLPILAGEIDLPTACDRLKTLANEKNGHDNVTIALVRCQVEPPTDEISPLSLADIETHLLKSANADILAEGQPDGISPPLIPSDQETVIENEKLVTLAQETSPAPSVLIKSPFWQWAGLCLIILGFLGYTVNQWLNKPPEPRPISTPNAEITPPTPSGLSSPIPSPITTPSVLPSSIPSSSPVTTPSDLPSPVTTPSVLSSPIQSPP